MSNPPLHKHPAPLGHVETVFRCSTCKRVYPTHHDAETCVLSDGVIPFPGVGVGDIVRCPAKWQGWKEGREDWIAEVRPPNPASTDHFDHITQYHFYWVVTAIKRGRGEQAHEWRYTIASYGAGGEGECVGWTTWPTHHRIVPVEKGIAPKSVLIDSLQLVAKYQEGTEILL